ncbi:SDR family NAD(P)-dependent oxidoreductase [Actinomycetospora sp. OC33-EN08]|uniref:SDR family NAD(P)-dependent oxidoreductase n=1 Tax=Actinomycetospora aurantiaca TaxID=3129233 RepID=A0ABU8MT71_9PSEU
MRGLLTGDTRGLGRATARVLVRHGAQVVVSGRDPDGVTRVCDEIGGHARGPRSPSAGARPRGDCGPATVRRGRRQRRRPVQWADPDLHRRRHRGNSRDERPRPCRPVDRSAAPDHRRARGLQGTRPGLDTGHAQPGGGTRFRRIRSRRWRAGTARSARAPRSCTPRHSPAPTPRHTPPCTGPATAPGACPIHASRMPPRVGAGAHPAPRDSADGANAVRRLGQPVRRRAR